MGNILGYFLLKQMFYIFHLNKQFQNMFLWVFLGFKSSLKFIFQI